MKRYFELRNEKGFKFGMVENIPDDVSDDMVRERIEVDKNGESIKIVDEKKFNIDIVFDWVSLDFDSSIDENMVIVDEVIQSSIEKGIEDKVVYTALSMIKKDPKMDIVIAMQDSFRKLTE